MKILTTPFSPSDMTLLVNRSKSLSRSASADSLVGVVAFVFGFVSGVLFVFWLVFDIDRASGTSKCGINELLLLRYMETTVPDMPKKYAYLEISEMMYVHRFAFEQNLVRKGKMPTSRKSITTEPRIETQPIIILD